MYTSGRWLGKLFGRSDSPPRQFSSSGFKLINTADKLEEENWEWYSAEAYYPVKLGEIVRSRYQVVGKLGYGAHSTVWLERDLRYVYPCGHFRCCSQTLKIGAQCT